MGGDNLSLEKEIEMIKRQKKIMQPMFAQMIGMRTLGIHGLYVLLYMIELDADEKAII